ncbi:MAG: HNH endonuclease [Janthinobacterium lividum]
MSVTYISAALRRLVIARADNLCEYCLLHEDDTFFGCEVDHIISEKHGGPTTEANLAYACFVCNRNKGSDIGSLMPSSGELVRFYHPRLDRWQDHFHLGGSEEIIIVPVSDIGRVTARIFGFNREERLLERQALQAAGRYPLPATWERINGAA